MKIKELFPSIPSPLLSEKNKAESIKNGDFQKLLGEACQRACSPSETLSTVQGEGRTEPSSNPFASVPLLNLTEMEVIRYQGLQAIEDTLKVLEEYQQGLSDPKTTLRKIAPYIETLNRHADGLHRLSEKISPSDPLFNILKETGILSAIEVEKFRRGDYL